VTKNRHNHRNTKRSAKRAAKIIAGHTLRQAPAAHRRIHVTPPSSASDIIETLSISSSDIRAALEAIDA